MLDRALTAVVLGLLLGCPTAPDDDDVTEAEAPAADDDSADDDDSSADDEDSADDDDAALPPAPVEIVSLGVGGVSIRRGDDLILTAPMLTNPGFTAVTLGDIASDPDLVDALLLPGSVQGAAAILVGHAHYDHLLDVPRVQQLTGDATVYGNVSMRHLIGGPPAPGLDRLLAVNDPETPWVDRSMADLPDPCTGLPAGMRGDWIPVGDRVRLRALASSHPAQFLGIVHFGEGCVLEPLPAPPTGAADWLEGATLAWLVDFLDADGSPAFRVYYQDAPTSSPLGLLHPDLLAQHPVDVAILNVGSYDFVRAHPAEAIANLAPRYVLGVHWEDFFQTQDQPIVPIPFHAAPADFDAAALDALGPAPEPDVIVDGVSTTGRYWRPLPRASFVFEVAP